MPVQNLAELNNMKWIHRPTELSSLEIFHCIVKLGKSLNFWATKNCLLQKNHACILEKMASFPKTNDYSACS